MTPIRFSGQTYQFGAPDVQNIKPGSIIQVEQPRDPFESGAGGTRFFEVKAITPDNRVIGQELSDIGAATTAAYSKAESFEVIA